MGKKHTHVVTDEVTVEADEVTIIEQEPTIVEVDKDVSGFGLLMFLGGIVFALAVYLAVSSYNDYRTTQDALRGDINAVRNDVDKMEYRLRNLEDANSLRYYKDTGKVHFYNQFDQVEIKDK